MTYINCIYCICEILKAIIYFISLIKLKDNSNNEIKQCVQDAWVQTQNKLYYHCIYRWLIIPIRFCKRIKFN